MKTKDYQLRDHFDQFVDRDARYPGYVLTDAAWKAFKKSESHGKKKLTDDEMELAAPLFGAKWSYEITIQSLWQELAEWWSMGNGWDAPLRATISDVWRRRGYDKEGNPQRDPRSNRVFLRALFKIRQSIRSNGFPAALMAYTGLSRDDKVRYLSQWEATNAPYLKTS